MVPDTLDARGRFAYTLRAVGARMASLVPRRQRAPLGPAALRELVMPDAALSRRADEIARILPGWLAAHSTRTFAWAALLAVRDGVRYDAPLLYAAAMLHDLGLTEAHAPAPGGCFAVSGAVAAERALIQAGEAPDTAARIADAIALHLEVRVAVREGPEAHLLNRGAALDVIGREAKALERALRDEVVTRWPRQACKRHLRAAIGAEARRSPRSRAGVVVRLGFLKMIDRAPFEE